jgi:hypothetical protein
MEARHNNIPVGGYRDGAVSYITVAGATGEIGSDYTVNGGTILFGTTEAATVDFVPPLVVTRYRFVNVNAYLTYLYPLRIVTTDGSVTAGLKSVVVFDALDVIYYPGAGFITAGNPVSVASRALSDVTPSAGTSEQILHSAFFPIASMRDFERLVVNGAIAKNGTTDTPTIRLRIGATGTTADTVVLTNNSLGASNLVCSVNVIFMRASATAMRGMGVRNAVTPAGIGATAYLDAALSNMDANAFYVTLTSQLSGSTDTVTLRGLHMEIRR